MKDEDEELRAAMKNAEADEIAAAIEIAVGMRIAGDTLEDFFNNPVNDGSEDYRRRRAEAQAALDLIRNLGPFARDLVKH
jgi:hypothetical protein